MSRRRPAVPAHSIAVPDHWTPEQALAVFEALHVLRESLWIAYGADAQYAWRTQLTPTSPPPDFDPDMPF
jgi:hypothetical protein